MFHLSNFVEDTNGREIDVIVKYGENLNMTQLICEHITTIFKRAHSNDVELSKVKVINTFLITNRKQIK